MGDCPEGGTRAIAEPARWSRRSSTTPRRSSTTASFMSCTFPTSVHPGNARFVLEKVDMLPFHWVTQKHPPRGKDMSTSLLYHGFGLVGYRQVNQSFEGGKVTFRVEQPRERHRCSACGSAEVWDQGGVERTFRAVPIGCKPVLLKLKVP